MVMPHFSCFRRFVLLFIGADTRVSPVSSVQSAVEFFVPGDGYDRWSYESKRTRALLPEVPHSCDSSASWLHFFATCDPSPRDSVTPLP